MQAKFKLLLGAALLGLSSLALAADDPAVDPAYPPDIPPPLQNGEPIEPEVTIVQGEDRTLYEYRAGGQLYMVKVVPKVGAPYYFLDNDGDGQLDAKPVEDPSSSSIAQWILFRW